MAFPKIIHQIWIQGEAALPEKFKKNMDITIKKNPEYKYMLWDEIKILELIQLKPEWVKKYYKFEYLHQKVDYAKLIILYMYGGIAIDMDAYTEQNLDKLFETYADYDLVVSLFPDKGAIINYDICGKSTQCLNNGNFFGKKKSDILCYMIDNLTTECSFYDHKIRCIHKTTGPQIFNEIIDKYINNNNNNNNKSKIKLIDNEYLEPCAVNPCAITENTYVVHKHENSWIPAPVKYIKAHLAEFGILILLIVCILINMFCF